MLVFSICENVLCLPGEPASRFGCGLRPLARYRKAMPKVLQRIDAFPFDNPVHAIERVEALLLADPLPSPMKRLRDHPPIGVIHFGDRYVEQAFAPPRGVYETADLRVEWQNMNGRQPFYHRNCGVDELSYQVCGERTVLTELGCVELAPGEFSR